MAEKYTKEYFIEQGRKGGLKVKRKYGKKHFVKIGALGGKKLSTVEDLTSEGVGSKLQS